MPNWCDNVVTFHHKDKQMIKQIYDGYYKNKGLVAKYSACLSACVYPPGYVPS